MNKEKIIDLLNEQPGIRFSDDIKISSIADVIVWGVLEREPTYYTSGEEQCGSGRRRSLTDIATLCKHYLPNFEFKDLLSYLVGNLNISGGYCGDVERLTLFYEEYYPEDWEDEGDKNPISDYSWTEFGIDFGELLDEFNVKRPN